MYVTMMFIGFVPIVGKKCPIYLLVRLLAYPLAYLLGVSPIIGFN